jgi:hypothetical protein
LKKTNYAILGVAAVILVGAILLVVAGGPRAIMGTIMSAGVEQEGLDTSATRLSEQGVFQVSYTSQIDPVPVNQMHTWTVHVESGDGQPLDQAEITVAGGMPQHGHGLPTKPQVTQNLGGGDYLAEGLRFNMPGWWEVTFNITAGGQNDSVTFNLVLK